MQPTPDNRFVYVPHVKGNNALFQYAFDAATGSIAPLDPVDIGPPEGSGPRHVAYHPDLPLAYFMRQVPRFARHPSRSESACSSCSDTPSGAAQRRM